MQTTGPPRALGTEARLLKNPFQHALESNGTPVPEIAQGGQRSRYRHVQANVFHRTTRLILIVLDFDCEGDVLDDTRNPTKTARSDWSGPFVFLILNPGFYAELAGAFGLAGSAEGASSDDSVSAAPSSASGFGAGSPVAGTSGTGFSDS